MWENVWQFFVAIYSNPTVEGIGIALLLGAIWLALFRVPLAKQPRLWIFFKLPVLCFLAQPSAYCNSPYNRFRRRLFSTSGAPKFGRSVCSYQKSQPCSSPDLYRKA